MEIKEQNTQLLQPMSSKKRIQEEKGGKKKRKRLMIFYQMLEKGLLRQVLGDTPTSLSQPKCLFFSAIHFFVLPLRP